MFLTPSTYTVAKIKLHNKKNPIVLSADIVLLSYFKLLYTYAHSRRTILYALKIIVTSQKFSYSATVRYTRLLFLYRRLNSAIYQYFIFRYYISTYILIILLYYNLKHTYFSYLSA